MTINRSKREAAWRLFAREFNSASVELPSQDQYSPSYVVSPLGALINRIFITGVLTESENVGTTEEPLWRGRVSDPTDIFFISAGQFQPKAAQVLAEFEPPVLVGIVGKARTYSPDETTTYVSIRVEEVKEITQDIRDYWVIEACKSLYHRLNGLIDALSMTQPDIQQLMNLGYNRNLASGIIEAINQYGTIDVKSYSELLKTTLKELSYDTSSDKPIIDSKMGITKGIKADTTEEFGTPVVDVNSIAESMDEFKVAASSEINDQALNKEKDISENERDLSEKDKGESEDSNEIPEQLIFEIIKSLIEENPDGVNYEDVQTHALESGLGEAVVEECIGSLIDKGVIYEPTIGIFKSV